MKITQGVFVVLILVILGLCAYILTSNLHQPVRVSEKTLLLLKIEESKLNIKLLKLKQLKNLCVPENMDNGR